MMVGWGLNVSVSRETITDDPHDQKRNGTRIDGTTVTHTGSRSRTHTHAPGHGHPSSKTNPQAPHAHKQSPPPLAQGAREEAVPRREDPGEHEARGEHQDDRGARGHVQRPGQVQAHQAP